MANNRIHNENWRPWDEWRFSLKVKFEWIKLFIHFDNQIILIRIEFHLFVFPFLLRENSCRVIKMCTILLSIWIWNRLSSGQTTFIFSLVDFSLRLVSFTSITIFNEIQMKATPNHWKLLMNYNKKIGNRFWFSWFFCIWLIILNNFLSFCFIFLQWHVG